MHVTALRFVAICVLAAALGLAGDALACSCGESGPPREALAQATAVFSGEVIAIEIPPMYWQGDAKPPSADLLTQFLGDETLRAQRVTVSVSKVWKGERITQRQVLYTPYDCCICGFGFTVGEQYLIYTYEDKDDKRLFTSFCSRTAKLDPKLADLNELPPPIRDFESARIEAFEKKTQPRP
jgi:hypothetical protein